MRTTLLALLLLGGVGCTQMQPIGPLARSKPKADAKAPAAAAAPVAVAAPQPVPPAMLITPGEVTGANAALAAQKLTSEFEYDSKTMSQAPKTAQVSVIRGGVKQ